MVTEDPLASINVLRARLGFTQIGANAVGAAARVVNAGIRGNRVIVPAEEQQRRFQICLVCDFYDPEKHKCTKCGCHVNLKARLATEHCPINKW